MPGLENSSTWKSQVLGQNRVLEHGKSFGINLPVQQVQLELEVSHLWMNILQQR
jgi:hypothetical protein